MTTKIQCAKSIRNLASMFKDMVVAADSLEAIGSLELACSEAESKLKGLRDEIALANGEKTHLNETVLATRAMIAEEQRLASEERTNMLSEADESCQRIVAQATKRAEEIVEKAVADGEALVSAANVGKAKVEQEVSDLKFVKGELERETDLVRNSLYEVQAELDRVKQNLKGLLG